jgi:glycosyltransferase involved in cell wall biosynthesis
LNWYPNLSAVRFIIESLWPLVKREFPKASLTVVGRNPPAWLKRAAEADPMIRVPGFVDDIRPYMDRAAVYLCPIFDGGGTKLKVLDAMAMAKPLVANPISMEGIDATPNHHWIPATSPPEFVSGIRRLFSDATLRREMGKRARDLICDRYSFSQIGQQLSERLEEHVRARKPG